MSQTHAALMKSWEVDTINSVLEVERMAQKLLPDDAFYKRVSSKILKRYGLNWAIIKGV